MYKYLKLKHNPNSSGNSLILLCDISKVLKLLNFLMDGGIVVNLLLFKYKDSKNHNETILVKY